MKKVWILLLALLLALGSVSALAEGDRTVAIQTDSRVVYIRRQLKLQAEVEKVADTAPNKTTLVWESDHPEIAKVSNGTVTGVSAGRAVIKASAKDNPEISASVEIEVRVPVSKITVTPAKMELYAGAQFKGEAKAEAAIQPEDAFHKELVWTSSNENVATVDANGKITAVAPGNAQITVTTTEPDSKVKATVAVAVKQAVEGISFPEKTVNVAVGKAVALKPAIEPQKAANKKLEWTSSDESVATVNAAGQVTGVSCGDAIITAKSLDTGTVTASVRVIAVIPVKKITLSEARAFDLPVGVTCNVSATAEPEDATIRDIVWTSSNEKVATVSETGEITGVGKGTASIIAQAADGSKVKASVNVRVDEYDLIFLDSRAKTAEYKYGSGIYTVRGRTKKGCVKLPDFGEGRLVLIGKKTKTESFSVWPVKPGTDVITIKAGRHRTTLKVYVSPLAFPDENK